MWNVSQLELQDLNVCIVNKLRNSLRRKSGSITWVFQGTSSAWLHSSGLEPLQRPRCEGKASGHDLSLALGEGAQGAVASTACLSARQTGTGPDEWWERTNTRDCLYLQVSKCSKVDIVKLKDQMNTPPLPSSSCPFDLSIFWTQNTKAINNIRYKSHTDRNPRQNPVSLWWKWPGNVTDDSLLVLITEGLEVDTHLNHTFIPDEGGKPGISFI